MVEFEWKVYKSATEHGDIGTAINSLNRILTIDKYDGNALDTLAILYLRSGANDAAAKLAFRALNVRESDAVTRVTATAHKNMGKHGIALEHFAKLQAKNPEDLQLLYEVAYANINLSKLNEALPFIKTMIEHPQSGTEVMQEFIKEGSQMVPYRSVAYNMLGFIQTKAGQNDAAVNSYQAALGLFPNYYLASNNLKVLKEKLKK
ncbi:MAG: hypothetical protein QF371_04725 [Flavobacteriales bacterium]|nr:hypothetical protein [Flavobacteriales bacterium]